MSNNGYIEKIYVKKIEICRNPNRSQGYCYALIETRSSSGGKTQWSNLELTLSSTGTNKAEKKINKYLISQNIDLPENTTLRNLITPYSEDK